MKLDWNDMEEVSLPHFYGGAKDMKAKAYFDKLNRISFATLKPGDCHYCPKGHSHSLENDGAEDLVFYTVVAQQ